MTNEYTSVKKFSEFYNIKLSEYVKRYISKDMDAKLRRRIYDLEDKISRFQRDDIFVNLVVAGEYNSGKSSFINSILSEKIIPVGPEPMTLAVSILKYGERKKILIEFNDETFKEISIEEFEKINHTEKEKLTIDVNDIKYIHFYYPDPYLSKVNIIDTPGFSTATEKGDDQKTRDIILNKTDVLLWIFNATNGTVKNSEAKILKELFEKSFKPASDEEFTNELTLSKKKKLKFFCAVNRIDEKGYIESEPVKNVVAEFTKELSACVNCQADAVIAYSAKKIGEYKQEEKKSHDAIECISRQMAEKNASEIKINTSYDASGNKKIKIEQNGKKTGEYEIFNYEKWLAPLDCLKGELENIRKNSKNIMEYSIVNDIYSLYNNTKTIIDFMINNNIQKEIDKSNEEMLSTIKTLRELKLSFKNHIEVLKRNFNEKAWSGAVKFLFNIEKNSGGQKLVKLNNEFSTEAMRKNIYDIFYSSFNIKQQLTNETGKICELLDSNRIPREYFLLLDKSRKIISSFETDYAACVDKLVNTLLERLPKFHFIGKTFAAEKTEQNILFEIAHELSLFLTIDFVFQQPLWKIEEYYDELMILLKIVYLLEISDLKSKIEELNKVKNENLKDIAAIEQIL
ncbi:MAG: dynamin family protein [Candidatus Wallbacteria bacterium]